MLTDMCNTYVFTILFTLYRIRRHTRILHLYISGTIYYVHSFLYIQIFDEPRDIFFEMALNIFHTVNKNSYSPT